MAEPKNDQNSHPSQEESPGPHDQLSDPAPNQVIEPQPSLSPTQTNTDTRSSQPSNSLQSKRKFRLGLPSPEQLIPGFIRNKLNSHARLAGIILIFLIVCGVSVVSWFSYNAFHKKSSIERFHTVVEPFQVVSTSPSRKQQNVSITTEITLHFNRSVNPNSIKGDFFVSPQVDGTFARGKTDSDIVFKPAISFMQGTIVKVMVHGEFQSNDGNKLGADFFYDFTTSIPGDGVLFQHEGLMETLSSAVSSQKQTYSLVVGDKIDPNGEITTYKSDSTALLQSLVYKTKTTASYSYQEFANDSINTNGLVQVDNKKGLKDNDSFSIIKDSGVYLVVATSNGKQVGHLWVVFSDFGVLLRQDDQKVVIAAQDFTSSKDVNAKVTLYSLNGSVSNIGETTVNGVSTLDVPFSPKLDIAVAESGNSQAIVPVSITTSLADLRSTRDLSNSNTIFGLTSKPAYKVGEKVQLAGFARIDNDGDYIQPGESSIDFYVAESNYSSHLAEFSAILGSGGTFSSDLITTSALIPSEQTKAQLHIYAKSISGNSSLDSDVASFTLTSEGLPDTAINVNFDKKEYLPTDQITARITATVLDGSPAANTTLDVKIYAKQYYENNQSANLGSYDRPGSQISDDGQTASLDPNGQGSLAIDINKLPAGSSQVVTVQLSKKGQNGLISVGGASAIVHLGNATLEFRSSKTVLAPGNELIGRIHAKKLSGSALANSKVEYQLTSSSYNSTTQKTETQNVASGNVNTDDQGYAEVRTKLASDATSPLILTVRSDDGQGNKIQAINYYYVSNPNDSVVYSELQLAGLDVYGSAKYVNVGDKLNLIVDAPKAVHALVTVERGRIHKSMMVDFNQGKNYFNLEISSDFMPSFTLVFSYFSDGSYHTDGVMFDVNTSNKRGSIQISPTVQSITAGSNTSIQLSTKDSKGNPLPTNLVVGVVDAGMYRLYDQVVPDIYSILYAAREITTNSSSSLTGMGSGGGKCGGGGNDQPNFATPVGDILYWQSALKTDASGNATINVNLPKGSWRVYAYSATDDMIVGSSYTTLKTN